MAKRKLTRKKQPLVIRSHALTRDIDQLLQQWSQEASDTLGWTVSSSAIVRALIRDASQQPGSWISTVLFPLIEHEIGAGVHWGSKKR
jgi:hypothetical protein